MCIHLSADVHLCVSTLGLEMLHMNICTSFCMDFISFFSLEYIFSSAIARSDGKFNIFGTAELFSLKQLHNSHIPGLAVGSPSFPIFYNTCLLSDVYYSMVK